LQKLFGWSGGPVIAQWTATIEQLGLRPAPFWADRQAGVEVAPASLWPLVS
jgi:hypothetical protein